MHHCSSEATQLRAFWSGHDGDYDANTDDPTTYAVNINELDLRLRSTVRRGESYNDVFFSCHDRFAFM